jgi:AcrR family transcriptional regulator
LTKGSLYYYFATKEDLLYEAHIFSLQKVIDSLDEIIKTDNPPDIKIKMAIRGHLEVLSNNLEGAFMLQHEFLHLPEKHIKQILSMRKYYEKNFVAIIEEGIKSGLFRAKNAKLAAFIILGAINWCLRWYSSSKSWSIKYISDAYIDLIFNGILMKREIE